MKNEKSIFGILTLLLLVLVLNASDGFAQPTDAQLKKQLTSPKTISVTLNGPGKIEWSKTYKKYVWSRYFTAKLKTDAPGELLVVKGYASYDVTGGRYVFWRTFTSSNNYEGKKNPTAAEINQALTTAELTDFNYNGKVIGEYESMKIAPDPEWEWHTTNSVSFNVVAVFSIDIDGGRRYPDKDWHQPPAGFGTIDRVEAFQRIRLYRDGAAQPWRGVHVSDRIPTSDGRIAEKIRLLERKDYAETKVRQMARMSKIPLLTQ